MIIDELEKRLRPVEKKLPPYPPKVITLASGEKMVVRQATRDDGPVLLETVRPLIDVERDFYDVVAARVYSELLGWYRYRVADEYCLVGTIDGVIASLVNGRTVNETTGMSYHTITIKRGLRCGAQMFAAKMEYHFEYLKQKEVLIVAESPIGYKRWMIEYQLEARPQVQHELGGVPTHVLTEPLYQAAKPRLVTGQRPVSPQLLATADEFIAPSEYPQIPGFKR
ncbi:hypothetical protein HYY75_01465 [bacterium]|nr:hypothetical protein [bacterium]